MIVFRFVVATAWAVVGTWLAFRWDAHAARGALLFFLVWAVLLVLGLWLRALARRRTGWTPK